MHAHDIVRFTDPTEKVCCRFDQSWHRVVHALQTDPRSVTVQRCPMIVSACVSFLWSRRVSRSNSAMRVSRTSFGGAFGHASPIRFRPTLRRRLAAARYSDSTNNPSRRSGSHLAHIPASVGFTHAGAYTRH